MILVDSSVWIDLLNNVVTALVRRLRELIPTRPLLVGDLILLGVLQGLWNQAQARLVERSLRRFDVRRRD
jgi:predicted nucleic acid-binding protein